MRPNPYETVRKIAEDSLSRLSAELQAGRSAALTNYLSGMSRFRRHSWSNVLLITAQRPEAPRVAGIHAWNDLGRSVKQGEKGVMIFAPVAVKQELSRRLALPKDDPFRLAGVRAAYVYDVAQTEGRPLPERTKATVGPKRYGEISDLARQRLEQRQEAPAPSPELRQTQTEAVAYVVSRALGLEAQGAACNFLLHYDGHRGALAQSLAIIQETSAEILEELVPEERSSAGRGGAAFPNARLRLDAEDFDKIHREYGDRLIQSITGFVRNRDSAEEIAARAFQRAWEKREQFRGAASSRTWLEAIARNEARQSWRRERMGQFDSVDQAGVRELVAPELVTDELEKREDLLRLRKAMDRLPVKYRRALMAHFVEGLPVREIARRERVPLGTSLSRIHTAKQLLRHAWEAPLTATPSEVTARLSPSAKPEARQHSQIQGRGAYPGATPESPEPVTWER
jgi:RNA polymerase sigma factor (sigma-70 family)